MCFAIMTTSAKMDETAALIGRPMAGDAVLLNGVAKLSLMNRLYQRLVRVGSTPYSHAALNYSHWTLIHAIPQGVDVICHSEVFNSRHYKNDWRVMRHRDIEQRVSVDVAYEDVIRWHAAYFFEQEYNFFVNVPRWWRSEIDSNSFCSELVAKVYRSLGVPFSRRPEKTLPADVAATASEAVWRDVTELYRPRTVDAEFFREIIGALPAEIVAQSGLSTEDFAARLLGKDNYFERRDTDLTRQQLSLFRKWARILIKSSRSTNALLKMMSRLGINSAPSKSISVPDLPQIFWDTNDRSAKE